MERITKIWLNIWFYVVSMICGGAIAALVYNRYNFSFHQISICLFLIVLTLHILEEGKVPGGFYYMYNTVFTPDNKLYDRYPTNRFLDMLENLSGVVVTLVCLLFFPNNITAVTFLLICIIEVPGHIMTGLKMKKKLSDKGKKTIYNPGLATTALGFLPLGVYIVVGLISANITVLQIIIGLILGIAVIFSGIHLPEMLLKSKENPFAFEDSELGYFKKFEVTKW